MTVDAAIDDQATGNDGVVTSGLREAPGVQRDFECTGHLEVIYLIGGQSTSLEFGLYCLCGAGHDVAMPS